MPSDSGTDKTNQLDSQGFTPTIILVILGLVIVAGGVLFVLHNSQSSNAPATPESSVQVSQAPVAVQTTTPTPSPITESNVDQSLTNASNNVDQTLKQANSDLTDLNNVDTSQDSSTSI